MIVASRIAAPAALGVLTLLALFPAPAAAQTKIVDEVKLGGLAHDFTFMGSKPVEPGFDLNAELLFPSLFTPVDVFGIGVSLRPHIGGSLNTSGDTSKGYFGLTLGLALARNVFQPGDAIFLDGAFGGVVHDGFVTGAPAGRKSLGSRFLGRRAGELGYQITPQISVSAMLDHIGNYGFAKPDRGLKTFGGRVGIKF